MSEMIQLFISYAHEDIVQTNQLVAVLRRFEVPYFTDQTVRNGDDFDKAITLAIKDSTHFVVLVSNASLHSQWVNEEINRAKRFNIKTYPILLGDGIDPYPPFPREINYLRLNPLAINEDQLARDLVNYLFDPIGVVPYKLFKHYGKRLPSEVFVAELLTQPVLLKREGEKVIIHINRDEIKNVVISNKGKNDTLCNRYVTPHYNKWLDLDHQIRRFIMGTTNETELIIATSELPLRWASGGVLSLIRSGDKLWVPLFFRDIAPVGWNVSLGSTEQCFDNDIPKNCTEFSLEKELSQPWKFLVREFLEETLIIDRNPTSGDNCRRREFAFENPLLAHISADQAKMFAREHIRIRQNNDLLTLQKGEEIDLTILGQTTISLMIKGMGEDNHRELHVLVVINPLELGIEVIKVFDYEIKESDCMLDGEILRKGSTKELVRMPFALISLEYLWHAFGAPDFVPQFTNDEKLPAVKGREPFGRDDLKLYGWDIRRRREIFNHPEQAKGIEYERYKTWCENYADTFESALDSDDPSGLPFRFTPATAKVINTFFNCCSHGRNLANEFSNPKFQ